MPNSACTAGSTTETTDIALLPSVTSSTVTSSRQAAVRESIRLASAGAGRADMRGSVARVARGGGPLRDLHDATT